jgi:hypothetical protein
MDARTVAAGTACRPGPTISPAGAGIGLALAVVLAGCQVDRNMQLAEKELRMQDSRIFELESHLADCHAANAAFRREVASLRRRLDNDEDTVSDKDDGLDFDSRLRPTPPSDLSLPKIDDDEPSTPLREPTLDTPEPFANPLEEREVPEEEEPPLFREESPEPGDAPIEGGDGPTDTEVSYPDSNSPDEDTPTPASEELPAPRLTDSAEDVEQIDLRLAVKYHSEPSLPVEIVALVEPQGASDRQVLAAGQVSLMIVGGETDTSKELARWEYPPDATEAHWRDTPLGTGMQFRLPWPGSPRPGNYRLWARFVGEDGRKHFGSVDFEVDQAELARRAPPQVPQTMPPSEGPLLVRAQEPRRSMDEPAKGTPNVAWRPSVEAANLPRLSRPAPPEARTRSPSGQPVAEVVDRIIPWSPQRPALPGAAVAEASQREPKWSPYR